MGRPRKLPDGLRQRGGTYYADFYASGRRVRKRLSGNLEAATTILNDLKARADKADFNLLDDDFPVAELKEGFLKSCRQSLKPATAARYAGCLENVLPRLAVNRVCQIQEENLLTYREERLADGASPRTVNMEMTVLGTMLRWGVDKKKIGSNPIAELKPLPHDPKEGRALGHDEVQRLLERSPQPWRDVWYCFLVTGLRKAELASLTFADVDWDNRELIVRGGVAKNHKARRIPIDNGLWEILSRQRDCQRQPGTGQTPERTEQIRVRFTKDHVFVSTSCTPLDHRSNLYHAFMRCCDLAGIQSSTANATGKVIEHVDVHSLRRTFATNLIAGGADPKSVQELLGHRTLRMTMDIYAKVHSGTKRQALARLSYGQGVLLQRHMVEYPARDGFSVQNGHQTVTTAQAKKAT